MRLSFLLRKAVKRSMAGRRDNTVIERDFIKLILRAGSGGNGILRYNGVGGTGGSIFARAVQKLTFDQFYKKYDEERELIAEHGENSKQTKLAGKFAKDLVVDVPLGVEIIGKGNLLMARCVQNKQKYLLMGGGRGGCAANGFRGEKGQRLAVTVHLKLRPNIGLIGYPNAGKSTLMKALVPDKQIEIADYPFTTTKPQVCYIDYCRTKTKREEGEEDEHFKGGEQLLPMAGGEKPAKSSRDSQTPFRLSLSIADLPGIVEGAAKNTYNGLTCLKHLEYSEIICMVVDIHGFRLSPSEPLKTPLETIALLNREMEAYERKMVTKPVVLLLNKVDVGDGEKLAQELCNFFIESGCGSKWANSLPEAIRPRYPIHFKSVHAVSAKESRLGNLSEMLGKIYTQLNPLERRVFEEDRRPKRKILI